MTRRPLAVALTGGLASGKSTVAAGLARRGAAVIDADRIVHELYRPGEAGATQVASLLGPGVLAADGSVDRSALSRRVLHDSEALAALNGVVHPLVRKRIRQWIDELAAAPNAPAAAVVEAALLIETGTYRQYDLLVVVWCRPEQQLQRAIKRGVEEQRAQQLLAAQMPLEQKREMADLVIDNSGAADALEAAIDQAWQEILNRGRTSG